MEKKCKLTISILASNRKDTIPKCLESIKPLLEKVDSELIVTDTGCDEDLLEIIRKYTDKIVRFQWCKDFAAARNVGLNMAHGQWFMYIDDDEWFEDVSEIIAFFNSEEEKEYDSANYIVRNYYSKEGTEYGEWVVGRIFRIYENTKFLGKIHEYVPFNQYKMKQLTSYVHHYGYVYETDEQRLAHSERNISLLEKEIEDNPADGRNYAHIYQEYRENDDPEMILKYTQMAIKNVDLTYLQNRISICSTYVAILWAFFRMKKYDEVVNSGNEILENENISNLTRLAVCAYLVEASMQLEEYEKCIEYAREYTIIYKYFMRNKEAYYKQMGPMLSDVLECKILFGVCLAGVEAAIEKDRYEEASYFLREYDWTKGWDSNKLECLKRYVDMSARSGEEKDTVYIYGMLFSDVQCSKVVLNRLQELKDIDGEGHEKICDIIAKIAGQPGYRSLIQIINMCKSGQLEMVSSVYKNAYLDDDKIMLVCDEFYEIALNYGIALGDIIEEIPLNRWEELIKVWLMNTCNKDIFRTKNYMDLFLGKSSKYMELLEKNLLLELARRKK
ncbi:MAG: glycosyltransferase [Lachnospiraceae bacterium]|nr:glycosyltransferase [Lachnospiraceae bacterium]